jgi:hypothetical protein
MWVTHHVMKTAILKGDATKSMAMMINLTATMIRRN